MSLDPFLLHDFKRSKIFHQMQENCLTTVIVLITEEVLLIKRAFFLESQNGFLGKIQKGTVDLKYPYSERKHQI